VEIVTLGERPTQNIVHALGDRCLPRTGHTHHNDRDRASRRLVVRHGTHLNVKRSPCGTSANPTVGAHPRENGDPLPKIVTSVHRFRVDAESVHRDRDLAREA
jgi:hypothetical protein